MSASASALKLYNTLSRTKQDFTPIDAQNVRMYVCGPTVYDFAHIGNARPVIVFDLLYRLLRLTYGEKNVTYVRNITDLDDKINARAVRDYPELPLNAAIRAVTEKTTTQYMQDVTALGCLEPTQQPRATDHIAGMIAIIENLLAKGHAYEANGEVLFRVSSMPDYGQLSGRNLEDNIAGARVAVDTHKENAADFVLWKSSSANEPGWDSPWGLGRPGWHIECSAMSEAFLGKTFDIHGGGLDLIFPHHENEIAQSRCSHDTDVMANYWLHNGFVQIEGKKMSKSDGNFVTINQLLETTDFGGKKWDGSVLRLAMLMTHYREPIDFSIKRLDEAERKLVTWQRITSDIAPSKVDTQVLSEITDDLSFTKAIPVLDALAKKVNLGDVDAAQSLAASLLFVGLSLNSLNSTAPDVDDEVANLVQQRLDAFNTKDFAKADEIRNVLAEKGIALMDSKDPETGARVTKWELKR